jgi:hypothetical protein
VVVSKVRMVAAPTRGLGRLSSLAATAGPLQASFRQQPVYRQALGCPTAELQHLLVPSSWVEQQTELPSGFSVQHAWPPLEVGTHLPSGHAVRQSGQMCLALISATHDSWPLPDMHGEKPLLHWHDPSTHPDWLWHLSLQQPPGGQHW